MDIRRWLDETVQPDPLPTKSKRRRKRSKSDSSLLDPPSQRKKTPPNKRRSPIEGSVSEDTDSDVPKCTRSDSLESSASSQRYARKPRRKTRPERYEHPLNNCKEQRKLTNGNRKDEAKRSKRKTKGKKSKKSGGGIVQSFQAKNVSGDRLTLKPLEKLGIFNKGKTSIAVKGRGLPDLVFSEMRFLQKNKDQTESTPPQVTSKKKRKKEHAPTKEAEISAFFACARPVLAEKSGNTQPNEGHQNDGVSNSHCPVELLSVDETAVPTVELPDKASYLGFGSRGPHHESTSYMSWSESIRVSSVTPGRSRIRSAINDSQFHSANHEGHQPMTDGRDASLQRPAPPSINRQKPDDPGERFKVPSLPATHQRISRSHSYPQHTPLPQRVNLLDRAQRFQSTDNAASPPSMSPSVPVRGVVEAEQHMPASISEDVRSKATSFSGRKFVAAHQIHEKNVEQNDRDTGPRTSSSLGRVLQDCNNVCHGTHQATAPRRSYTAQMNISHPTRGSERRADTSPHPPIQRVPTVRFSGVEAHSPGVPNFSKPSIYEQQMQRQQLRLEHVVEGDGILQDVYDHEQIHTDEHDEVAYDDQIWDELADFYEYGGGEPVAYQEENTYAAEGGEQQRVPDNNVVKPGFWRPHRLY
ncbi:hypothetical protein P153DRAFT_284270 [Dothidotthia symphoricarpi CBS 119687]|uniref:Uncharacterized protein n=1 Tax=Dothidotthia symphoricarpi CBS 119687 TaxID=1392245 RepID=A0A6A6ANS9_9PLEO|nr:uncharacterized protein P153DRAFT_284270 [Dothidotthia symphoricarpi CBS 119687]KAF2132594.1 hypothetical protein P153DRAFT_284270 [Dothidotthia symphoricarpi CBS 119687]